VNSAKESRESSFDRFAYSHLSRRVPRIPGFEAEYEQSGIQRIYKGYLSTAFLASFAVSIVALLGSIAVVGLVTRIPVLISLLAAAVLAPTAFASSIFVWLLYPIHRKRSMRQGLENQLAYSVGILGVLSSSGIGVEELFERISMLQTDPVLESLSKRFIRNIKVFGMDTASALREVADHCPSVEFTKLLHNIEVAFQTRGSLRDLISFESQRLFAEKQDKLKKSGNDLSVMAELYISLVVVMPIFFIVMFVIFQLLPTVTTLPPATLLTNVLLFIGVPVVSVVFIVILDSIIQRT
jgi:archaeal flagellar protein FlaJ